MSIRIAKQIAKAIRDSWGEPDESAANDVAANDRGFCETIIERSGLSSSAYIEVFSYDADGDEIEESFRIRVSDHESRPTYERRNPSEYHVGDHQDADGDWIAAVAWACRRLDITPVARIARRLEDR